MVRSFIVGLLNVVVTVLSVFYISLVLAYVYTSLTPGKAVGFVGRFSFIEALQFIILFGSAIYYFKSKQPRMKLISSAGCISMIVILLMIIF
ncbi:MAG: hypothetical protein HPY66_2752 [Firmicutes bacterium]|nr:hypothetical protein [Bacillota bacterium]